MHLNWSMEKLKFSKTPLDLHTGLPANSDEMGGPFDVAVRELDVNRVLCYRHPVQAAQRLGLIDCDHCVAPDGTISPLVQHLLRYMDAYAEFSVSDGIHVLCWLESVPPDGHKDREWNLEFYWASRPIPVTGNRVVLPDWQSPFDIPNRTHPFLRFHKSRFAAAWNPPPPAPPSGAPCTLSPAQILERLFREREGKKWQDIYNGTWQGYFESPSDADLALLMKFAFYTGKDREMMDSLFSGSPLSKILIRGTVQNPVQWRQPKWVSAKYRQRTLDRAIERTSAVYAPPKPMSQQEIINMRLRQIHEQRKSK